MKLCLFWVALILSIIVKGQTYSLFQPNAVPYFTSQEHHLKGIRVDSVKSINNEIHYFLYRTPRGAWNYTLPLLDTNGGSWVGKEVAEQQDGVTLIPNHWNDTVVIHTQAILNDTWRFYDDTSQHYYEATVTAYDTVTISGSLDSLKIITISAYNPSGINSTDSIHGKQIILSKHNGVYQTFALYSFPFPQPSLNSDGMDYYMDKTECVYWNSRLVQVFKRLLTPYPTTFNLYDYQIGDVFFRVSNTYYSVRDSVMGVMPIGTTKIEYHIQSEYHMSMPQPQTTVSTVYDTVELKTLSYFDANKMPDETGSRDFVFYNREDSSFCFKSDLIRTEDNHIMYDGMINNFEPDIVINSFKIGLGRVNYYRVYGAGGGATDRMDMIFSSKKGKWCNQGNYPLSIDSDLILLAENVTIAPNPASEEIFIQTDLNSYQVIIYTITGTEVMHVNNLSKNGKLSVRDLANGIYFLKLFPKEANGFVTKRFVIQH